MCENGLGLPKKDTEGAGVWDTGQDRSCRGQVGGWHLSADDVSRNQIVWGSRPGTMYRPFPKQLAGNITTTRDRPGKDWAMGWLFSAAGPSLWSSWVNRHRGQDGEGRFEKEKKNIDTARATVEAMDANGHEPTVPARQY